MLPEVSGKSVNALPPDDEYPFSSGTPHQMDRSDMTNGTARRTATDRRIACSKDPIVNPTFRGFPSSGLKLAPHAPDPLVLTPLRLPEPTVPTEILGRLELTHSTTPNWFFRHSIIGGSAELDAIDASSVAESTSSSAQTLSTLLQLRKNVASTKDFAVLKLRNISWDLR